jgi:chaperone BCS1
LRGGGGEENGNSITLTGLLNFNDGLWSCCGSERIFVFTTNHIEKLDPALLRSGRMDMHIFMSYCSKQALKNYLGVDLDDSVLKELEEVIEMARMTPVDISEVLIKNRRKKEKVVDELLEILKVRAERNGKNGGVREKDDEEEEQEKRALDSDSPKQESEIKDDFKEGLLEEEEKIK